MLKTALVAFTVGLVFSAAPSFAGNSVDQDRALILAAATGPVAADVVNVSQLLGPRQVGINDSHQFESRIGVDE